MKIDFKKLLGVIVNVGESVVVPQVPGAALVDKGIRALVQRDADPTNDAQEVGDAVQNIVVGSVEAYEGLSEQDIVNDPVLVQLAQRIRQDVELFHHLAAAKKAAQPAPSDAPQPVS